MGILLLNTGFYANLIEKGNLYMAKHLLIHGVVQGVGFRYSMQIEAQRSGITGWVRNRRDGTVEAVVDGPSDAVGAIIDWARRGPPAARVTDVLIADTAGDFADFELRPSVDVS